MTEPHPATLTPAPKIVSPLQAERVIAAVATQGIRVAPIEAADGETPRAEVLLVARPQDDATESDVWVPLAQGETKAITTTSPWETVIVRNELGRRAGVHVPTGSEITMTQALVGDEAYVPESFCVSAIEDARKLAHGHPRPDYHTRARSL
ncbi:hypothetical protein GGF32_007890 [Allomyces javanicus]|nr:hypothetical protein GGF32_007890 [Allomyces javanicus]